jgi:hypothetical protein
VRVASLYVATVSDINDQSVTAVPTYREHHSGSSSANRRTGGTVDIHTFMQLSTSSERRATNAKMRGNPTGDRL